MSPPGEPPEPHWPIEPKRLSDTELQDFVLGCIAEAVFTSAHLPSYEKGGPAFTDEFAATWPLWGLALENYGLPPDTFTASIGVFWSYIADASAIRPRGGLPTFIPSPRIMHREDWLAAREQIERARRIEQQKEPTVTEPDDLSMKAYVRPREAIVALLESIQAESTQCSISAHATQEARVQVLMWVLGKVESVE